EAGLVDGRGANHNGSCLKLWLLGPALVDQVRERVRQFTQALVGHGTDLEDGQSRRFEVCAHHVREFLSVGDVDFVEDDDLWAFGKRHAANGFVAAVGPQLRRNYLEVAHGVAVRFKRGGVEYVRDD